MDKAQKVEKRKLHKKAIKLQNASPVKLTIAEAMKRAAKGSDDV